MFKKPLFIVALIVAAAVAIMPFFKCNQSLSKQVQVDPAFSQYISAYTTGIISSSASVKIILANATTQPIEIGVSADNELFDFSPAIKGTTTWIDNRTIEFKPTEQLKSGQFYSARFALAKVMDVPADFKTFEFGFETIHQSFDVFIDGITTTDTETLRWYKATGILSTADNVSVELVEKLMFATQNDKKINITWQHESNQVHRFVIDSIVRTEQASTVLVKWNGEPLNIDNKGEQEVKIPSLSDFSVISSRVVGEPEQYVSLQFSDPLQQNQNLEGLINISGSQNNARFVITENEVRVYPGEQDHIVGARKITVEKGVKNIIGKPLKARYEMELLFQDVKPAVRMIGKGAIIPSSDELLFPFEAVNLKAVDVKIFKIYENNILQYLQVNDLDGNQDLARVGKVIYEKTVQLQLKNPTLKGRWNAYSLDLSKLIKSEPGAIYKVMLNFKKEYSTYTCDGTTTAETDNTVALADETSEENNYDGNPQYENAYYDNSYYDDYDYTQRDNPCHNSYYSYGRKVERSVFASDLGIITKCSNDGSILTVVTDLKTTKPVSNTTIEFYDYQQQVIASAKTNSDGMASIKLPSKPFVLVAKNGSQRGYMKLDDGSSQSLSMFDVSGTAVKKGLKGFLYGERGVWRPGDTLFLTFMLEDKQKQLPADHPVILELRNPRNQVVKKITKNKSVNGFYDFIIPTEKDAPTGNWNATVKVGNVSFAENIKIETIVPNRLKLNLDFGVTRLDVNTSKDANLHVNWLTGATASNLEAKVEVSVWTGETKFKGYDDFIFNDPARKLVSETQTVFEGRLNDNGDASVSSSIDLSTTAPGMLNASFTTRVFEQGGGFSVDRFTLPYSPFETYVGVKTPEVQGYYGTLPTDKNHVIEIATVNADGKPVSSDNIKVEIYKMEWRWWWDSYEEELASYVGNTYYKPIREEKISTINGKGKINFNVSEADWGRYFIHVTDEEGKHATGKVIYFDWPSWAEKDMAGANKVASLLTFTTDKTTYTTGETATILIPSGEAGRALVTIETGSKVLEAHWVETQKGKTEFKFTVTAEMSPNVYIHATLIQPHGNTKNDLPIRLYGIVPVQVEDANTHLRPIIKTADVWRPESVQNITVSEENGKDITYTLAVVDEGLLDITRFKTPDPWKHFYAREALGVRTWDVYDMVLGAYAGELQRVLSIGGDGAAGDDNAQKANRFKPMVRYIGPFYLKKGEKKTHAISIPQYVGSVRVMVVAGQNLAYGNAEKAVPVRTPLMILGTLPRVVGPSETVDLPVTVFAMEKQVKNVSVTISPNNLFTVEGGNTKSVTFNKTGDKVVYFKLHVKDAIGFGKVNIAAQSGSEKAKYNFEIDVRNPNPKSIDVIEAAIEPGTNWTSNYTPIGMIGTNKGTLELSTLPPINLEKRLNYLIEYPHGCVEQTTSSVFPQLFLSDIIDLKSERKVAIDNNIKAGIQRLRTFQVTNGGLSYWQGGNEADEWGTSYAGHFMIEAELKGYSLPIGFMDNWKRYQKQKAQVWYAPDSKVGKGYYFTNSDLDQAYRLYTLALAKAPELGAMNRLKEYKEITAAAKWRLAAAYAIAGQTEVAKKLIASLPLSVTAYNEYGYTYGSSDRDEAMILETLTLLNQPTKAASVAKEISKALSANDWMSTQTTAYCLMSMSRFAKGSGGKSNGEIKCTYAINGKQNVVSSQLPIVQGDLNIKGVASGAVQVNNSGTSVLFARIILEGIPLTGDKTERESNLQMSINYTTLKGEKLDITKLEQGTDFVAEVTVTHPGIKNTYLNMALSQVFPSGWEIHNVRMQEGESAIKSDDATYQDIRDDRVYTYYYLNPGTSKTYRIILNAAYTGKFYLPTTVSEAMYDNSINARKAGRWVEVVKPGESL